MVDPNEALQLVLRGTAPPVPRLVPLTDACGFRATETLVADRDYPPFPRVMMDGFAVRLCDAGKEVEVAGEVAAGVAPELEVSEGRCAEVMTGACCPSGAEAVVPREDTRREGKRVMLPEGIAAGQFIAPPGSDCRQGATVVGAGQRVTPLLAAAAAAVGASHLVVIPSPTLAIVVTGRELTGDDARPGPCQIRDANGPMLECMTRCLGLRPPLRLHAGDRLDDILAALERAVGTDIVVLTGGVSAGRYDLVPEAVTRYGAETIFHKVRQRPGKPMLFARRGRQLLFGLPGNPLSCHLGFHRYVTAAVRILQGHRSEPPTCVGRLAGRVEAAEGFTRFVPARAEGADGSDKYDVQPLPVNTSADIFSATEANCYLTVPPGQAPLQAGSPVRFSWFARPPGVDP